MRDVVKGNQFEVKFCKRCGDEKKVNKFNLCKTCQTEVDYEFAMMYETKTWTTNRACLKPKWTCPPIRHAWTSILHP